MLNIFKMDASLKTVLPTFLPFALGSKMSYHQFFSLTKTFIFLWSASKKSSLYSSKISLFLFPLPKKMLPKIAEKPHQEIASSIHFWMKNFFCFTSIWTKNIGSWWTTFSLKRLRTASSKMFDTCYFSEKNYPPFFYLGKKFFWCVTYIFFKKLICSSSKIYAPFSSVHQK